jgi:hypothetical protein
MKVMVETANGPKAVNVCDGRRAVFATPAPAAGRGAE